MLLYYVSFFPFAKQVTREKVKHELPFSRSNICYNKLKQVHKFASKKNVLHQAKTRKYMCICLYVCLYAKIYF